MEQRPGGDPGEQRESGAVPMDVEAARRVVVAVFAEDEDPSSAGVPSIPGYTIEREIGHGGSGQVYLAFAIASQRRVAIKLYLRPLRAGPESERAWREVNTLASLRLPCVPGVLDYGLHEGRMFMVTEFVDGEPIHRYCDGQGLDRRQRVEVLARTAEAVHGLHERGVIHRDIKPSNILVDAAGQPVILDLGIAQIIADDPMETITAEGVPIGTPAFMSPEQAAGRRDEISTRSDIYGLGAVGYLLLTGKTPHEMETTIHEAVRRVAQDEARDPRVLEASLPRPLSAVLHKAVARAPEQRYDSAASLAADLRSWLAGEPVEAGRPSTWRRTARWVGRHPVAATVLLCAAIAIGIVGGTGAAVRYLHSQPARLEIGKDRRYVNLAALSGRILRTWDAGPNTEIFDPYLIDRPQHLGGGKVVFLRLPCVPGWQGAGREFTIWDADAPDEPIWVSPRRLDAPGGLAGKANQFKAGTSLVRDFFPERPGSEIACVYVHGHYDPCAVVIHDVAGNILYEVWHWGAVGSLVWLEDPRLLVCRAQNNERSLTDLGYRPMRARWPGVIFAVQPGLDAAPGWLNGPVEGHPARPVWYEYFQSPELTDQVGFDIKPSFDPDRVGDAFTIDFRFKDSEAAISRLVDSQRKTIDEVANDFYRNDPALPRSETLRFGPEFPSPVERDRARP